MRKYTTRDYVSVIFREFHNFMFLQSYISPVLLYLYIVTRSVTVAFNNICHLFRKYFRFSATRYRTCEKRLALVSLLLKRTRSETRSIECNLFSER